MAFTRVSPQPTPVRRIGLTGGIGSGKSTVSRLLEQRGTITIDADAISRGLTAPQGDAIPEISRTFGPAYIDAQGALDRDKMRALIFENPQAKHQLEAIIHPLVSQITAQQTQQALQGNARAIVYDIPLLVESGRWVAQLDRILVVDCTHETQIQRVMARNHLDETSIRRIIAAQATRAQRLHVADWVIFNENIDLDTLNSKVLDLPL